MRLPVPSGDLLTPWTWLRPGRKVLALLLLLLLPCPLIRLTLLTGTSSPSWTPSQPLRLDLDHLLPQAFLALNTLATTKSLVLCSLLEHCLDLCRRLAGTPTEVRARAQRAWDAGQWAKATLENKVAKPRPTPKLALQATCYIILRGPGIERPVRVASSAEYFKLLPTFEGSVSHSFPSLAEGRVYCLAAGVAFPDPADQ